MDTYYIDGEFITADKAVVSVNDMIVLRGYGVFDFMRTYNRRPFYLMQHIERLANSAKIIGLNMRWTNQEIFDIVIETIEKNPDHKEVNVRLVVTGGVSPDSVTPQDNQKLFVMVTPKHELPSAWYSDGVKIITNPVERYLPDAKSTNYLNAVVATGQAKAQGGIEAIYVDRNDRVLEGTTTNIFLFIDGKLVTPGEGILPGITRGVMLDLLKDEFEIEIRDIKKEELAKADEIFITASNKEVVPVIQVDDMTVGDGKVGERVKKVLEIFKNYTTEYGEE